MLESSLRGSQNAAESVEWRLLLADAHCALGPVEKADNSKTTPQ